MSKFIDKLKKVSKDSPQPMGFRVSKSVSEADNMILVASLAQADIDGLSGYVAGADAGLLCIPNLSSGAKALQKICKVVPDIPWGGWLTDTGLKEIKPLVKAGCDFVVFPPATTSLAAFEGNGVGKVLQLETSLGEGLLRAVDELPIDAVLVSREQEGEHLLTWRDLMIFQRFAGSLSKPLLVSVPSDVAANELQALRDTGVDGIIVEVGAGCPARKLSQLRQIIDKLTVSSPHKRKKIRALLPFISREADITDEEIEEE